MNKVLVLLLGMVFVLSAQDIKSARQVNLEKLLMAPCCYGGAIYDHESGIAFQMKDEIATMIADGKSDKEILGIYEKKYGEKILAIPKAEGFNLAAWWVPMIIGMLALLVYIFYAMKIKSRTESALISDDPVALQIVNDSDDITTIIDRELDELRKKY